LADALRDLGEFSAVPFIADRIHLFQSDLRPDGPIYTPLWNVSLGHRTKGGENA
jgi:2'-5' RNA ligase